MDILTSVGLICLVLYNVYLLFYQLTRGRAWLSTILKEVFPLIKKLSLGPSKLADAEIRTMSIIIPVITSKLIFKNK